MNLADVFDYSLKNLVSLEKLIFESIPMFQQNPSDHLKYIITNMCVIARGQINILEDILPKVCNGSILTNYQNNLNEKYGDILKIERELTNQPQK